MEEQVRRATASLEGLATGDAYGNRFFDPAAWGDLPVPGRLREPPAYPPGHAAAFAAAAPLPPGPWPWTDDTEMACGIVAELQRRGEIDPDALAAFFAAHVTESRDYGASALDILSGVRDGGDWRRLSASAFEGEGSLGNGGAMRIAPLGAWFADDLDLVTAQARLATEVTHTHPEGVAGAVAVAVAAAMAARGASPDELLEEVLVRTPEGVVAGQLEVVRGIGGAVDATEVAKLVGNGRNIVATDTVALCVWAAARHLDGGGDAFARAVRAVVACGGDMDTTAAVTGGIVGARTGVEGIPAEWLERREPLPDWVAGGA